MSYSKRRLDQKHDEDFEVEDDNEEERDEDVKFALAHFLKKGKGKSSERLGRNLDGVQKFYTILLTSLLATISLRTN